MPSSHIQSIKQIARQIKYRELTNYRGQTVVINGIDTIEVDLKHQMKPVLTSQSAMEPKERKYLEGVIAKYGLSDVDFVVPNTLLEKDFQSGIKLLKTVKFFPKMPSPNTKEVYDNAIADSDIILDMILAELSLAQTHQKIILYTQLEQRRKLHVDSSFFPATFTVQDTCLTNVRSIWLNKHFYL